MLPLGRSSVPHLTLLLAQTTLVQRLLLGVNTGRRDTLLVRPVFTPLVGTGSGYALLVKTSSGYALLVNASGWCSVSGLATDGSSTDRTVLLRVVGGEDAAASSGADGGLLAAVKVGDLVFTVGNVVVVLTISHGLEAATRNLQRPQSRRAWP